jgi:hypothetical protein
MVAPAQTTLACTSGNERFFFFLPSFRKFSDVKAENMSDKAEQSLEFFQMYMPKIWPQDYYLMKQSNIGNSAQKRYQKRYTLIYAFL